jgi:hypothetical protein
VTWDLTSIAGIIAIAAAAVALAALILALAALMRVRRIARAQRLVLGSSGERDVVEHARAIEQAFEDLRQWVEEVLGRFDGRLASTERGVEGSIAHRSLIRYDAYGEMSGQQSSSLALLDRRRSGIVISSILHRDQARFYVKQVHRGASDLDLSPEELEAIEVAVASPEA